MTYVKLGKTGLKVRSSALLHAIPDQQEIEGGKDKLACLKKVSYLLDSPCGTVIAFRVLRYILRCACQIAADLILLHLCAQYSIHGSVIDCEPFL